MVLNNRVTSAFPLAIGTSLAMESFFPGLKEPHDVDRTIPNRIDTNTYRILYINITTVIRNIIASLPSEYKIKYISELVETTEEEIDMIYSIFNHYGSSCSVRFYGMHYEYIKHVLKPNVAVREIHTDKQIKFNKLLMGAKKQILYNRSDVTLYQTTLPATNNRTLIITHMPIDLLNVKVIPNLHLVESHTGVLKTKLQWYTKYFKIPRQPMGIFPWAEKLLYFLGDNNFISPASISLRRDFYELAVTNRWNTNTTDKKITVNLRTNKELHTLFDNMPRLY